MTTVVSCEIRKLPSLVNGTNLSILLIDWQLLLFTAGTSCPDLTRFAGDLEGSMQLPSLLLRLVQTFEGV
jgi:hypothetical protein